MLFFQLPVRANDSVTLSWDASNSTNAAGYKIYYGTTCRCYSNSVTVGNTTQAAVTGLVPGRQYYFAATTLDAAGNESDFSNEAVYVVPVTAPKLISATHTAGQFSFTVTGDTGQPYVVQASTDMAHWTALQTNNAPFQFTDQGVSAFSQRFYRVVYQAP